MYSAIIDNTALVYLTHLPDGTSFLQNLRNIFHTLYIPMEVKNEYARGVESEPARNWLLERINPEQGFFRLCASYDSFTMIAVYNYKGMNKGEAESYAQYKKIQAQVIISDDKDFASALNTLDKYIKVYNTLHLICWLDIYTQNLDWGDIIKKIHHIRPFKSNELRTAYIDILEKFGINKTKKEISKKCSLKGILAQP